MAEQDLGQSVRDWTDVVRRARLGKVVKSVALMLATYADFTTGRRIFPGVARLAVDCEISYNTAQSALTALRNVGLIERVRYGTRRKGMADEYRLILAPDLIERVEVLSPAQVTLAAERMAGGKRGKASLHPTERGANDDDAEGFAPRPAGSDSGFAPHGAELLHPAGRPPTTHDRTTSDTPHDDEEVRTDVAVVAREAVEDQISSDVVGVPARRPPLGSAERKAAARKAVRTETLAERLARIEAERAPRPQPAEVVEDRPDAQVFEFRRPVRTA